MMKLFLVTALVVAPIASAIGQATDSMPGVTRVGRTAVERDFKNLKGIAGVRGYHCQGGGCVVDFDTKVWAALADSSRRQVTARIGMALGVGEKAPFVELHNTSPVVLPLSSYRLRSDHVELFNYH